MNQIAVANLMMNLKMNNSKTLDESMVRHMILNSIRMYRQQFNQEFGEVVLTYDSKHYWRRDYFPNYKAGRKKGRERDAKVKRRLAGVRKTRDQQDKDFEAWRRASRASASPSGTQAQADRAKELEKLPHVKARIKKMRDKYNKQFGNRGPV